MKARNSRPPANDSLVFAILGGLLAPLLVVNIAKYGVRLPLWIASSNGQQFDPRVVAWMMLAVPIGTLLGLLCSEKTRRSLPGMFGMWVGTSLIGYFLFFQQMMLMSYFDLRLIDVFAALFSAAMIWMVRLQRGWGQDSQANVPEN